MKTAALVPQNRAGILIGVSDRGEHNATVNQSDVIDDQSPEELEIDNP